MKKKCSFNNAVAETLLIPLYMRAVESRRADAILHDPEAERLVDSIDYDYSQFDHAPLSAVGCVVRGRYFDDAARRFIAAHEKVVAVNVGCGLDTRYQRIGQCGNAVFYELDLPEVIALRRELIPEPPEDRYMAASLDDSGWMDSLRAEHPDAKFIFIAEGVLMYFYEYQVRRFIDRIAERFGGGEVWFDVCGSLMYRRGMKPDSLRRHAAQIRSGISDGHRVEQWNRRMHLIEQANYMKFHRRRWGFFFGQILGRMPRLCYGFSSMLGYSIAESGEGGESGKNE